MSRYSQLYIERGARLSDSRRARIRLHVLVENIIPVELYPQILRDIAFDQGARAPTLRTFYDAAEIRDVLDSITTIRSVLIRRRRYELKDILVNAAARIFDEEHLAYKVGNDGIIRPFIDAEFDANRASAIEALSQPRFQEARSDFEAAFQHLRNGEGKAALRMMFPAVETAAKVLFLGRFATLSPNEVERHIKPVVLTRYAGNQPAINAGRLLLDGMKDWINAAQPYRHGQHQEEPAEPPLDFVVAHLSVGAAYLRWMIELCSPVMAPDTPE
jgi:hypothetical protein